MMEKGKINVTTENIFPIIKKFLYSDHEIFLRELISNAVDATQKLKTLASVGDYKGELGDLTIAAPDMGGTKRANAYSRFMNTDMVIGYKLRKKANVVEDIKVIGELENKDVVIVDDMIDTAGTICLAADMMIREGAHSVRVCATHPVLSGDSFERIEKS